MDRTAGVPMDDPQMSEFENAAGKLCPAGTVSGRSLRRSVKSQLGTLCECRDRMSRAAAPSQPAQWLLDNLYLIQRETLECAGAFRRSGRLRAVRQGARRIPLILALAELILQYTMEDFTLHRLEEMLSRLRKKLPLTERELSLLVSSLKLAVAKRLESLCPQIEALRAEQGTEQEIRLTRIMEELFRVLRFLISADFTALLEGASGVESVLQRDPSGIYPLMDDDTRRRYRQAVCTLAKENSVSEQAAAEYVLSLSREASGTARHVGWYLFREPMGGKRKLKSGAGYIGLIVVVTLAISLFLGFTLHSAAVTLLLLLPVSDIIKNVVDFLTVHLVPPRHIHRLALEEGLPAEGRTLCVIAALLSDEKSGPKLAALLERYRLANRDCGENLLFGILADLPDSAAPMGTKGRRMVEEAKKAVCGLNEKYGGGFYLFFRPPVFHIPDERYMGWERKRGALIELVRLLKGRRTSLRAEAGDLKKLGGIAYVITLDTDTALNVGSARELVGAMLHPLNRPDIDGRRRIVQSGYGLLQPRCGVELEAANRSQFSRIFAGQGGVDPYGSASSDVYHDLFDEGTYTGKGIFDVDAYFTCLDRRFPQNAVLSHDLLEGCYLHAGLIGDVELTDSYPGRVTAYFARLHRWVRGDWQVVPWLFGRVRNEMGEKEENPLDLVSKWKIFDNLRRSLAPSSTLLALLLGMCFSGPVFAAAATAATLSAASNLLLSGTELAFRGGRGLHSRYHSTIIAGLGGVILQTLVQLLLLPIQAWTCASAVVTSIWRQSVTHKRLLDWVTASSAEHGADGSILGSFLHLWPACVIGVFALLFARFPAGGAIGLIWLLSPLFAWALSRTIVSQRTVSEGDKAFLLHEGALIWRYFSDFLRPEDHWLPPDNWQAQPNPTLARRTSPTNIGLAMLSVLAAADLDYCPREQAVRLISYMFDTVEKLPKWRGHLYNWYDTATAKPLYPRYISTVDSGNLCGCLIALREGLYEWGEDKLARRAEKLSAGHEFAALYDEKRKLFYIGFDVEAGCFTKAWYDLMASEARQTSYIAIARGEISPRHWRKLGRTLVSSNDYSGMASWTGTMFEYFMPHLLLPAYQNSLIYESLAFCVTVQKRRTARLGVPWGISESSFYALDAGLNYQYKAHGVQKLGLKRNLDSELVVSPYSTFLALPLAPKSAVRNLRRLRELGLEGKYGLFEAVDFTPSRLTGNEKYQPVRSFMAHHLGMSLVAVDNALKNQIMQRRFMRDCSMAAFRELLQEKVPVGAEIIKGQAREVPEKPGRSNISAFQRAGSWQKGEPVRYHPVSNGAYTVLCGSDGSSQSRMGTTALTVRHCVTIASFAPQSVSYRFSSSAAWVMAAPGLSLTHTLQVPEGENGELRVYTLKNQSNSVLSEELVVYLEPILARERDYLAHPVFSKLFLESDFVGDGVVFTRRPRRFCEGTPSMAVLWDAPQVGFDTSREEAIGRGGLRGLRQALKRQPAGTVGAVLDPCLLARVQVTLTPGESRTFSFAVAASDSSEDAVLAALRLLGQQKEREHRRLDRIIAMLSMTNDTAQKAFELLDAMESRAAGRIDPKEFWPYGISGDLPVVAVENGEDLTEWPKIHQLLTRCGYPFDLAFLLDEGGDYRRPFRNAVLAELKADKWEHQLDARGGIHLVERPAPILSELAETIFRVEEPPREPNVPFVLERGIPDWEETREGTFRFQTGPRLPPVGWSQILCNADFGWFTDETGCGHLWLGNARENQLTPWRNDPLAIGGGERFHLKAGEGECSLFADADGRACTVIYAPGYAKWVKQWDDRKITTTAFVPQEDNVRYLIIELEGEGCELLYRLEGRVELRCNLNGTMGFSTRPNEPGPGVSSAVCPQEDLKAVSLSLNRTIMYWNRRVSSLKIRTPNEKLNHYMNGWALYQVIACRLFGRTSRYQNGGAYGFRDQLQDVCALILTDPGLTETQVLRACERQFEEGDVQHWWHPPEGKGVRTRITDDLLWLPYVLCEYWDAYGSDGLLKKLVPFVKSPVLACDERERYEQPVKSLESATVYEHAVRAVECALRRGTGGHGLVLMGTGDWNDGMDLVGEEGKGESVWLTWFLSHVLERFSAVCAQMGEPERGVRYRDAAVKLAQAANEAWDGAWFLRGYYDDGSTLGSHVDDFCQIDSIAQSFAVLSSFSDREKANRAVSSAIERLFDKEAGIVKIFDPPFDQGERDPGYIRGYVPGVRENGGQYTHAAVWLAMACFRLGRTGDGYDMLSALLPANHDTGIFRAEPYVLSADVYSNPEHVGRGGWSWYTGAAGWYYRTVLRDLLGIRVHGGKLFLQPNLPQDWTECAVTWRSEQMTLHIEILRTGENTLNLDGKPVENGVELAQCAGEHTLRFTFG